MLYGVIIAGGAGKRLWPKSRVSSPKYILKFKGKKSLLEETISRLKGLVPRDNVLIITNKEHLKLIRKELPKFPKKNIIAEPVSRNTAPAICLAASIIKKKDPEGVMFVMPADHIMEDKEAVKKIFSLSSLIVGIRESLLTLGIKPDFASTGYGYIRAGRFYKRLVADKKFDVYKVDKFVEKPDLKKAKQFVKAKRYFWNSGIFIGKAKTFLEEIKRYKPAAYRVAERIEKGIGTKRQTLLINRYYKKFPDISIDYAVMEKTKKAYVIKAEFPWKDVGSWKSLEGYVKKDKKGNIINADCLSQDLKDSVVIAEKGHLIASAGLDNIVIVQTKDATLVCSKDKTEDVKKLVELAERKGLRKYI